MLTVKKTFKTMNKLFNLIRRSIPQSTARQMQEVEHVEVFPERELSKLEVHGVTQLRLNAQYQLRKLHNIKHGIRTGNIQAIENWASKLKEAN